MSVTLEVVTAKKLSLPFIVTVTLNVSVIVTKNDHGNFNECGKVKVTETPKYRILVKV